MAFNYKAFAAGFMEDQARQINTRVAEAREYKRELKENAEASKSKISKLAQLGNLAKSEIARLRAYGVDDRYINAGIASGPKGLFDLSTAVQEEAARRNFKPGQKFDEFEVEALIDMDKDFKYGEVDAMEFYEMNTALTKPSLGSTKDKKRGVFGSLLGLDLDDAVRARLDEDAYFDGYSVMDINEISKQEAYESVAPGTYFSFAPTKAVDVRTAVNQLQIEIARIDDNISERQDEFLNEAEEILADENRAKNYVVRGELMTPEQISLALQQQERRSKTITIVEALAADNPLYVEKMESILKSVGGLDDNQIEALKFNAMADQELERTIANKLLESAPKESRDVGQRIKFTVKGQDYEAVVSEGDVISIKMNGETMPDNLILPKLQQIVSQGGLSSIKGAVVASPFPSGRDPKGDVSPDVSNVALEEEEEDEDVLVDTKEDEDEEYTLKREGRPIDKIKSFFEGRGDRRKEVMRKVEERREQEEREGIPEEEKVEYDKDNPINLKDMTEEEARDAYANLKSGDYFINPLTNTVHPKP